jgi:hypothetical protein
VLTAGDSTRVDPQRLLNLLKQGGGGMRVAPNHKIYAPAPKRFTPRNLFEASRRLLDNLSS